MSVEEKYEIVLEALQKIAKETQEEETFKLCIITADKVGLETEIWS